MARTTVLRKADWEAKPPPIYFGRPLDWEIFTAPHPHGRVSTECHYVPATFGVAVEADQLTDLLSQAIRSIEGLADPYGGPAGEDPFEYRSVPLRRGRIVRAKVRYGDRVRPMPIDDD
jgi:hypothetical protein